MSVDGERMKSDVAAVFDRAAATYDRTGVEFFKVVGRQLVEVCAPKVGESVLDLGCGRGAAALPAARAVGPDGHVLALDLAPGMIAGLREEARAAELGNVEGRVGDAERPDVEARSWDLVIASLVLFFLPDPGGAIRRYRPLLTDRGRLAFSWFGERDVRWDPVFASLDEGVPAESRRTRRPSAEGLFSSVERMHRGLREAGYGGVETVAHVVETRYPDLEGFWAEQWSHGRRGLMERLDELGTLEQARRRTNEVLSGLQDPDGSMTMPRQIRYTVAR